MKDIKITPQKLLEKFGVAILERDLAYEELEAARAEIIRLNEKIHELSAKNCKIKKFDKGQ